MGRGYLAQRLALINDHCYCNLEAHERAQLGCGIEFGTKGAINTLRWHLGFFSLQFLKCCSFPTMFLHKSLLFALLSLSLSSFGGGVLFPFYFPCHLTLKFPSWPDSLVKTVSVSLLRYSFLNIWHFICTGIFFFVSSVLEV